MSAANYLESSSIAKTHPNLSGTIALGLPLVIVGLGAGLGYAVFWVRDLSLKRKGIDEKPKNAYKSLCSKSSQADQYIQLYKILGEKGLETKK